MGMGFGDWLRFTKPDGTENAQPQNGHTHSEAHGPKSPSVAVSRGRVGKFLGFRAVPLADQYFQHFWRPGADNWRPLMALRSPNCCCLTRLVVLIHCCWCCLMLVDRACGRLLLLVLVDARERECLVLLPPISAFTGES